MRATKPEFGQRYNPGHWTINESSLYLPILTPGDLNDYSGHCSDGTLQGGAAFGVSQFGAVLECGLNNPDYLNIPHRSSLVGMAEISICFWAKNNKTSIGATGAEYFINKIGGGADCYNFAWDNNENIRFSIYDAGLGDVNCIQVDGLTDDQWHFWVGRWKNTEMSVWKDGEKMAVTATQTGTVNPAIHPLQIGGDGGSASWDGKMSHVNIIPRGLTELEIKAAYSDPWAAWKTDNTILFAAQSGAIPPTGVSTQYYNRFLQEAS